MALTIKNPEVVRLAAEVAELTGETKTEAVRRALAERRDRLRIRIADPSRAERTLRFLEREVWPRVPQDQLERPPGRAERANILGYGPGAICPVEGNGADLDHDGRPGSDREDLRAK